MVQVNDGSSVQGLQIVVNKDASGYADLEGGKINTGAAVQAAGVLVKSPGGKQSVRDCPSYCPERIVCVIFCGHTDIVYVFEPQERRFSCLLLLDIMFSQEQTR